MPIGKNDKKEISMKRTSALLVGCLLVVAAFYWIDVSANPENPGIIGGQAATPGQFPHFGDIGNGLCGSSLLEAGNVHTNAPAVFLTDGHCLTKEVDHEDGTLSCPMKELDFYVTVGDTVAAHEGTEQTVKSRKFIVHEKYLQTCDSNYDLALLITDPVAVNDYVRPIRPLLPQEATALNPGVIVTFAGKGLVSQDPNIQPDHLRYVGLIVTVCESSSFEDSHNLYCTGRIGNPSDICFGDSGTLGQVILNGQPVLSGPPVLTYWCGGLSAHLNLSKLEIFDWLQSTIYTEIGVNIYTPTPTPQPDATATPTLTPTATRAPNADSDLVPDMQEDLNHDGNLENDDTDQDGIPNYKDRDDDGDLDETGREVAISYGNKECQSIGAYDADCDGIPNYLEIDEDGDGVVCERAAFGNPQFNSYEVNPDLFADHVDPDDDNDGVATKLELGPAFDGNCATIPDGDNDGIKSYLDPDERGELATPIPTVTHTPTLTPTPTPTPVVGIVASWATPQILVKSSQVFSNSVVVTNTMRAPQTVIFELPYQGSAKPIEISSGWVVGNGNSVTAEIIITDTATYEFTWISSKGFVSHEIPLCWNQGDECEAFELKEDVSLIFLPLIRR